MLVFQLDRDGKIRSTQRRKQSCIQSLRITLSSILEYRNLNFHYLGDPVNSSKSRIIIQADKRVAKMMIMLKPWRNYEAFDSADSFKSRRCMVYSVCVKIVAWITRPFYRRPTCWLERFTAIIIRMIDLLFIHFLRHSFHHFRVHKVYITRTSSDSRINAVLVLS